jgi:hypothetical protein
MKTLQEQLDDAWTAIGEAPFPIPEELFEEADRIQQLILEQENKQCQWKNGMIKTIALPIAMEKNVGIVLQFVAVVLKMYKVPFTL